MSKSILKSSWLTVAAALMLSLLTACAPLQNTNQATRHASAEQQHFLPGVAVATAHPLATQAALDILAAGGNAFDAAVAASAALAVVEPSGSGMGGGGFWLLHRQYDGKQVMLDGREMAPGQAHADMYLDAEGNVNRQASLNGPLAAGIPGQAAALVHLSQHYGNLPLASSLQPAIRYAEQGFALYPRLQRYINLRRKTFNAEARRIFLDQGATPTLGHVIKQADLAQTLRLLAEQGRKGFYQGVVAQKMLQSAQAAGGIWAAEDLLNYRVIEREPVRFQYGDANIVSAALPSSGGIVLGQILQMIEAYKALHPAAQHQAADMHLIVEAMRRAYRDRALYLGDEDFVAVDKEQLLDADYLHNLAQQIQPNVASASADLAVPINAGADTTHFSIIDHDGNRVAATLSINYPFGSGHVAAGTGVLLNNEMDDFVAKAGEANVYGLVGGKANQIAPGKRPLSSMTPTFVEREDSVVVLGTPGGSRIITMVALAVLNILDRGFDLQAAIDAPRYHHQYLPDAIQLEKDADYSQQTALQDKGHQFKRLTRQYGNMQAVAWQRDTKQSRQQGETITLSAASDSRAQGQATVLP